MFGSTRRFWRRIRRTVVAAATVAAVAACAVGVPTPTRNLKLSSERYPCENHPCGCPDAESCWRDCCCTTNAAKLAWAEEAGVTPPEYVVAAAAREAHEHDGESHLAADEPASGCCASNAGGCCRRVESCCCETAHAEPAALAAERGVKVVHLVAAMKCRGLSVSVALLPPSLPVIGAEFFPATIEQFQSALSDSLLYDEPYPAVASPPPDGAAS